MPTSSIPSFDTLPDSGYIRESHLVRNPKHPERPAPLPFGSSTLWRMVKAGKFPQPIKLSAMVTAWRVVDVKGWMAGLGVSSGGTMMVVGSAA